MTLANPNPEVIHDFEAPVEQRSPEDLLAERDDSVEDPIDSWEVFEMIRRIRDPEHPYTLEQLRVVDPSLITVTWKKKTVKVLFTPTVPHCSLTTVIGLSIRLQLERNLPQYTKIDIYVSPGSHIQEEQVNKQLNDKERVSAALEKANIVEVIESCIYAFQEY